MLACHMPFPYCQDDVIPNPTFHIGRSTLDVLLWNILVTMRFVNSARMNILMAEQKLNATAASLLGFLHEQPMSGWDLYTTAQERMGNFWSITQSQVYRELSAMAEADLVEAGERGRRDRQPYRITESGRSAFHAWVMQVPGRETIRFPLLLTMLFGEHLPPDRLASFLAEHRARHAARLERDEQMYAAIPEEAREQYRFSIATMRFGIAYERAALEWFDQLPDSILKPSVNPSANPPASGHPETDESE